MSCEPLKVATLESKSYMLAFLCALMSLALLLQWVWVVYGRSSGLCSSLSLSQSFRGIRIGFWCHLFSFLEVYSSPPPVVAGVCMFDAMWALD
jgi:hypothetical protein